MICKDHLGNIYKTKTEMCRAWGITHISTLDRRLAKGLSLEEALTYDSKNNYNIAKPCTDHLGNVFDSENSMCKKWGVSRTAYRNALAEGYSSGEALFNALKNRIPECQDHLGNTYKNHRELCKHWGISIATFRARIRRGYSLEEALTLPLSTRRKYNHR